jgi:hypothetical protein
MRFPCAAKTLASLDRDGHIVLTQSTTHAPPLYFRESSSLGRIPRHCIMAASKSSRHTRHYATLQPRTLNVAQSAIRKKWKTLPENSQLRVKQLLRSIELSVQKDSRAGHEAQLIINDIANTYVTLSRCMTLSELTVSQIDPKAPTHAISTKNRGSLLRLRSYLEPHCR